MKHKFHGQPCIYCGAAAEDITSDHAIGKKFFLEDKRDNLPQVPACRPCNNRKSELEGYLMTVLPFGAKHPDAAETLAKLVPPRLDKNAKLARKLRRGYERSGGTSIPFEHKPMEELFAMIAKALAWQHWGIRLENGYSAIASLFTNDGEAFFEQMLSTGGSHASGDLGEGTFTYEGAQAKDDPRLTMWRFRIYGGVDFGGDPNVNGPSSLAIAVTGRAQMIQNLRYSSYTKEQDTPKVGRNEPCPCGSGKKHKKCHGSVIKTEARDRMLAIAAARPVVPSTYQPIAAHGYAPWQLEEMLRYARNHSPAR
jgi:SEC-C motif